MDIQDLQTTMIEEMCEYIAGHDEQLHTTSEVFEHYFRRALLQNE